jgi:hypothetical protein
MGVRTAERMTGVVLSLTCTDPVQVRCGKSMPKQPVCHLKNNRERASSVPQQTALGPPAKSLLGG